jgi:hypothetical protein
MTMPRRTFLFALLIALLALVMWVATRSPERLAEDVAQPDSMSTGFKSARLYFASVSGESLVVETREQLEAQNFHDRVASLVDELERGPRMRGLRTISAGTTVQHVYLDDRGLLTLDLSRTFRDGFRGGSAAEFLAIASLTRTLAANLPEVRRVMLVCGGQPLPTLGGHLPLDRPIDVADLP